MVMEKQRSSVPNTKFLHRYLLAIGRHTGSGEDCVPPSDFKSPSLSHRLGRLGTGNTGEARENGSNQKVYASDVDGVSGGKSQKKKRSRQADMPRKRSKIDGTDITFRLKRSRAFARALQDIPQQTSSAQGNDIPREAAAAAIAIMSARRSRS